MKKVLVVVTVLLAACGQGPKGDPGQSVTGPAGADGTQITIVQFCPGVIPTYPSNFPEIGECINGQLYGVYSANGGFLALLPPGAYSSNGINASCNFTILPNCVIQN